MLTGSSRNTLDAKGRLAIPAKWRSVIEADKEGDDTFVWITPGLEDNLHVYPRSTWLKLAAELSTFSPFDADASRVKADFFGRAERVKVDKARRVLVPEQLREAAGIDKEVVIVGGFDLLYLWSAERYDKRTPSSTSELFGAVQKTRSAAQDR